MSEIGFCLNLKFDIFFAETPFRGILAGRTTEPHISKSYGVFN
jgi:hypothetical protein